VLIKQVYNRTQEMSNQLQDEADEEERSQSLNLVDHFAALLLAVFIESGLLEVIFPVESVKAWGTDDHRRWSR
jgi:hypothetical protein